MAGCSRSLEFSFVLTEQLGFCAKMNANCINAFAKISVVLGTVMTFYFFSIVLFMDKDTDNYDTQVTIYVILSVFAYIITIYIGVVLISLRKKLTKEELTLLRIFA